MLYDVIVVGAGPAGAVLAHQIASQGHQVLVLEKANLPRYKPCGGGLPFKTIQALPFDVSDVFEVEPNKGILTYDGAFLFQASLPLPFGAMVIRPAFDQYLIQRATAAGAQLRTDCRMTSVEQTADGVTVHTETEAFNARVLVGADGVNSTVAAAVDLLPNRTTGVALEAELSVPSDVMQRRGRSATFDFGALPRGYGWIFPKREQLSVGVFRASKDHAPRLKQRLERFLDRQPDLSAREVVHLQGHRIPLGGDHATLHRGRVLLIGDAANLVDPWLGEGIYYAVRSAQIAADVIREALDRPGAPNLSHYTRHINKTLVPHFQDARQLARLVYGLPYLCSRLLERSAVVQEMTFGAVRGTHTFRQLKRALVRRAPRILVQTVRGSDT